MASECCLSLTKYFLFLFNLIFFLLGSLLLSMGLWILLSENRIFIPSPPYISISLFSYFLIISGSVTMSLGFLGCLGSLKTVKCLLATYFILLTVLLAAQIVGGVLFYTQKTELAGSLKEHTLLLIKSFGRNDSSLQSFENTLEYIQQEAKCCGWHGTEDWEDSIPCSCYNIGNATVNATYEIQDPNKCNTCFSDEIHSNHTCGVYKQGCSENIKEWLDENLLIILVVILAISVVEICGMILSMCLYKEGSVDYNTILH
ncbi:leukocyte antigen CD37-like [Sinocyclocheilus grahami]|uniref:leukocyte antigen CD37-like n=1 Tax=Sinocyclocheilus grahami TaxID=75366 RepID=UPI0007ACF233|nr:PREDICTED: leukocyte antigen CD37-like [Sinocyclocheilus grahami]XP_016104245.1 PREDICTED: leukocyte antigen CD37-like [Sinocyclocheilus grahami]